MSEQIDRDDCFICGDGNRDVLERHHIVPRRFGGSDASDNLVDVCPTCHRALETLYDKRFYDALGVVDSDTRGVDSVCEMHQCTADADVELTGNGGEIKVCNDHRECGFKNCDCRPVGTVATNGSPAPVCDDHRVCSEDGCRSRDTKMYRVKAAMLNDYRAYCEEHGEQASLFGEQFEREW